MTAVKRTPMKFPDSEIRHDNDFHEGNKIALFCIIENNTLQALYANCLYYSRRFKSRVSCQL